MDLNHLHLHVADLDRSQGFYEAYFEFREKFREEEEAMRFLENPEGFLLALAHDPEPSGIPEWFHFGFCLPDADAVRRMHSRMSGDGIKAKPVQEYADYVNFRAYDPDGYQIEVYWE